MFAADIGTISSRGQVALPKDIRKALNVQEGDKILFVAMDDAVTLKKVESKTFAKLTEPFRKAKKRMKESDVVDLVHEFRRKKRARHRKSK